jgi:hypothetical protein
VATKPDAKERFSWAYLVKILGKALRDLAILRRRADRAGKHLATFGLHTEIRFASPAALAEFGDDLRRVVAELAGKYHDDNAPSGRSYTLFLGSYSTLRRRQSGEGDDSATN